MIIHKLIQGTPEWHAFRAEHFTASDAPAMMGVSKYKTRAQLLHEKATGITQDIDAATQRLFDNGHRFEALARPLAEAIIGDDLYPVVGSDGNLAASFDGLTLDHVINFEHKTLNAAIEACQTADDLPGMYHVQSQHQMMVSGSTKTLFMATRWDENDQLIDKREFWIERDEVFIAGIKQGWVQFEKDKAEYVPVEVIEKPKGAAVLDLPAVMVSVSGQIAITDNLDKFSSALKSFVETQLIREPKTDQDFADLESQVKTLKKAEEALDSAEAHMLAQVDSVDTAKRTIDMLRKIARDNRLMAEKLVKTEKENIKTAAIMNARKLFMDHISALNAEIRPAQIEGVTPDFNGSAKNKRTMASLHDAIDTELARVKIESDAQAKDIRLNLALLKGHGKDYEFLFNDLATIAHKAPDDFAALVAHRVSEHKAAEEARLAAERQRMQEQAEADARAKVEAEQSAAQEEIERQNARIAKNIELQMQASAATCEPIDPNHPAVHFIEVESSDEDVPSQTETVLIIRSAYQPKFIRKMVADSLAKYGVVVDSVELDEVVV